MQDIPERDCTTFATIHSAQGTHSSQVRCRESLHGCRLGQDESFHKLIQVGVPFGLPTTNLHGICDAQSNISLSWIQKIEAIAFSPSYTLHKINLENRCRIQVVELGTMATTSLVAVATVLWCAWIYPWRRGKHTAARMCLQV